MGNILSEKHAEADTMLSSACAELRTRNCTGTFAIVSTNSDIYVQAAYVSHSLRRDLVIKKCIGWLTCHADWWSYKDHHIPTCYEWKWSHSRFLWTREKVANESGWRPWGEWAPWTGWWEHWVGCWGRRLDDVFFPHSYLWQKWWCDFQAGKSN